MDERLPAGTLIEGDFFDPARPRLAHDRVLSSHGLSIADQLELAARLDLLPENVHLVAVGLGSAQRGRPPGTAVVRQVPAAASRIVRWSERLRRSTGNACSDQRNGNRQGLKSDHEGPDLGVDGGRMP
jgi:hypothetical protein